jgi:hypothetical protein
MERRTCALWCPDWPVVAETHGAVWPGGAVFTLHAAASSWEEHAVSVVDGRRLRVAVDGRGAAARPRTGELARAV